MNNKNMLNTILNELDLKKVPAEQYSPLTLAYIGDCVYELYVRSYLIKDGNRNVNALHKTATRYVCCHAQAETVHKIEGMLDETELAVYKRGRNTKSHVPKNSEMSDYRAATGLEALLGYLYISDKPERICELMRYVFAKDNV